MTKAETIRVLKTLKGAYQYANIDEATILVFHEHLERFRLIDVQRAAAQHIAASPKFPAVSELRERITTLATREAATAGPPPEVPEGERVSQREVRAAVHTLLTAWQQREPPEREPGEDDE